MTRGLRPVKAHRLYDWRLTFPWLGGRRLLAYR